MAGYRGVLACVLVLLIFPVGCGSRDAPDASEEKVAPHVVVVNYPLFYMAKRIVGDQCDVSFPVPESADPTQWHADDQTMQEVQQASLVLAHGGGYAHWLEHMTLPEDRVYHTTEKFKDKYIKIEDQVTHTHGPGGEHSHSGTAVHTWFDPRLAMAQALGVASAVYRAHPDFVEQSRKNYNELIEDLKAWQAKLDAAVLGYEHQPLLGSHPVYQYLARYLKLNLKNVYWEPSLVPTEKQLAALDELLKEHPAKLMLWEEEPIEATRKLLEARGIRVVVVRPCDNRVADGDWLTEMNANTERLQSALSGLKADPSN